ncbi:MAG: hypothetical protein GEU95_06605 [Rhizobiales bacterium]|nr:hypothetical protein [Hyphomicrobiales bacterium]
MARAKVVALHSFNDDEALMWLSDHVDGRVETSLSELAQQFGWPLTRLRRRIAAWVEAGLITKASGGTGRIVLAPTRSSRETAVQLVGHAFSIAAASPASAQRPARSVIGVITACLLVLTALGLTAVGLVMNARFAASFGQTAEAAILLAGIGLAVDLLAVTLPSVGVQLWHRRSILAAAATWTIWLAVLTLTLLAAMGFASTNIGDAVAGRAKIAGERALAAERIEQLRSERASIAEMRTVAAIEVELQRAQPEAQWVWKMTDGCRDVTRPASARACATVLDLRQAQAAAARRDAIDTELRDVQSKLAALPAVTMADPQATTAAETVAWLSAGTFNPAPEDVARLRALGLALMPSLAGLIGMLALALARRG